MVDADIQKESCPCLERRGRFRAMTSHQEATVELVRKKRRWWLDHDYYGENDRHY